jgi:gamma-glutamyl phosphate reductase
MERTHNLDALAKALVEAARNLRTAKLDSERIKAAAAELDAATAVKDPVVAQLGSTNNKPKDQDVSPALAPIGVLAKELADNAVRLNASLQKLGEDLLRAAETLGQ